MPEFAYDAWSDCRRIPHRMDRGHVEPGHRLHENQLPRMLDLPLRWKKPRTILVRLTGGFVDYCKRIEHKFDKCPGNSVPGIPKAARTSGGDYSLLAGNCASAARSSA